jgi:5-formyltetrahydrofolate cyclo-ligase
MSALKVRIRADMMASRRALGAELLADRAARVQDAVRDLIRRAHPVRVAGYAPAPTEPGGTDLPEVLRAALPPGGVLLLPVLRDDLDLDWAAYDGRLVPGGRGQREPAGPVLGVAAIATVSLVVVPALAVDRHGVRLGRGGGSFDRALARVPAGVPVVALLHDGELRERDLPALPYDRPVSAVIMSADGLVHLPR